MYEENGKAKNLGDIYRTIYYNGPCSRQSIAARLDLSLPTVTNNLNQLKKNGLIYNSGSFKSTGGRKANMLRCVPDACFAAGMDITRNHLSIVIINLDSDIIASKRMRIAFEDTDAYHLHAAEELENIIQENSIPKEKLLGVGISLPVIVGEDQKSISYATVIEVSGGIYERMKKHIPYPFLLFNDANSGGLAEAWISPSQKTEVYLSLSSSVGGATINGRDISIGNNCRASEFGHMTIIPNGRKCYCGQRGCLNAYCSAKILTNFTDGDLKRFFDELKDNVGFQQIFDEYLDHLALAVNNLRMCYDCDVILGGNVGAYMTDYIDILRAKAIKLNPYEQDADYIRVCHYKTEAAAAGAALYYVNQFVLDM